MSFVEMVEKIKACLSVNYFSHLDSLISSLQFVIKIIARRCFVVVFYFGWLISKGQCLPFFSQNVLSCNCFTDYLVPLSNKRPKPQTHSCMLYISKIKDLSTLNF